jgi:transcriptional regulator with XRE-family HTH domain
MRDQAVMDTRYVATNLAAVLDGQGRMRSWLAGRVGVSESSVSKRVGVSESSVSKIVAGTRTVDRDLGEAIAAALDVPFFVLFALRGRSEINSSPEEAA